MTKPNPYLAESILKASHSAEFLVSELRDAIGCSDPFVTGVIDGENLLREAERLRTRLQQLSDTLADLPRNTGETICIETEESR